MAAARHTTRARSAEPELRLAPAAGVGVGVESTDGDAGGAIVVAGVADSGVSGLDGAG
jgi:hypothetical protein